MKAWRNSLEAHHERLLRRTAPPTPAPPPPEMAHYSPDLRHCLAVLRAACGHGFPVITVPRSSAGGNAPLGAP